MIKNKGVISLIGLFVGVLGTLLLGSFINSSSSLVGGGTGTINNLPIKTFLALTDTPNSYSGQSGKTVVVNGAENALEFTTPAAGVSFGTDNQIPFTNAGGTDFDYSANLTYDGATLGLDGLFEVISPDNTGSTQIGTFYANNQTIGVGLTYEAIKVVGSNANIDYSMLSKGTGSVWIGHDTANTGIRFTADDAGYNNIWFGNRTVGVTADTGNKIHVGLTSTAATGLTVLTASGYLGINDTTPSYPLDVTGEIRTTSNALINGYATINGTTLHTTASVFNIQRASDATDLFQVDLASGNTTQLFGTFYAPVVKSAGGSTSAPGMTFNGDTNTGFYGNGSGAWGLTNDGTTSIYANSSANVHIGGTSPLSGYKLTLTGNQYVNGQLDAEYIGYNSIRSLFGERGIFLNELSDVLWRANRRFTVTSSWGGASTQNMFDGNFESTYAIPISTTDVININVANQSGVPASGITYPEGKLYVHFYYTSHQYSAISARVQMNVGWVALAAPVDISTDTTNKVLEFTVPNSGNYLTDIELTVTTDGTNPVWITGLNYLLNRWTSETEPPYVDKHQATNRLNGDLYFLNTSGANASYISNSTGNNYFTGKLAVGGTSPGTYHLNVTGNILGNSIYTNSGEVFGSLGTTYLRTTGTSGIHIGDNTATDISLAVGGGKVGINQQYPSNKLHIVGASATTSENLLNLDGGATGFSGANDTGAYSLIFSGTSYQTTIVQNIGAKIEMAKENTWNYADTPTGIKGSLNFYTSSGTPNSPVLTKQMAIKSSGNVNITTLDTDLTAPSTSGTTKMVVSDANGLLSFTTIPTSGSSTFIGLTDVPANFTGSANKYVRVNAGETALEFVTLTGGGDALVADPLSQFAATTSLQLKGVISDETGSGALVFADTPTLIAPILGTPTSVTLTNGTGLPLTGLVSDTTTALGIGSINLGHASDTTIARVSAGIISVEGVNLLSTATGLQLSGGTMAGAITLGENTSIALDPAGSADGKYSGTTIAGTAGYAQAFGDLVYLDPTDSRWEAVDANAASAADGDARGILGMVVSAGTDGTGCVILLNGVIRADANFAALTINNPIYVSETAGDITQTQPTTTDVVIRIIGAALTADEIYFNPDNVWITAI